MARSRRQAEHRHHELFKHWLEAVAVRKMMALSLTFDHRVVDGAPAARFLKRVKQFVEHPYVWLTS